MDEIDALITRALAAYTPTGDMHADNALPMLRDIYHAHGFDAAYRWAAHCMGPRATAGMRAAMAPVFLLMPETSDEKKEA